MNDEAASDDERSEQWAETSQRWPAPCSTTHTTPDWQPRSTGDAAKARRLRHDVQPASPAAIPAEHADLDERCRRTLRKLLTMGCTRANTPYALEQFQVSEQDLHYLKRHGLIHAEASALVQPVLLSCERQKAGADVGKLTIILNVHLH